MEGEETIPFPTDHIAAGRDAVIEDMAGTFHHGANVLPADIEEGNITAPPDAGLSPPAPEGEKYVPLAHGATKNVLIGPLTWNVTKVPRDGYDPDEILRENRDLPIRQHQWSNSSCPPTAIRAGRGHAHPSVANARKIRGIDARFIQRAGDPTDWTARFIDPLTEYTSVTVDAFEGLRSLAELRLLRENELRGLLNFANSQRTLRGLAHTLDLPVPPPILPPEWRNRRAPDIDFIPFLLQCRNRQSSGPDTPDMPPAA